MRAFCILLLIFGAHAFGQAPIERAEKIGPLETFWNETSSRTHPHFPPAVNLALSPWQTFFSFSRGQLILGGRSYSAQDSQFPAKIGSCHQIPGQGAFSKSRMMFCRAKAPVPAEQVIVNGEMVGSKGSIALTEGQPLKLQALWMTGELLEMEIFAPQEEAFDVRRTDLSTLEWSTQSGGWKIPDRHFSGKTLPKRRETKTMVIEKVPFFFKREGLDSIEFRRALLNADSVPLREKRPFLPGSQALGTSEDSLVFSVASESGTRTKVEVTKIESGTQDYEFNFAGQRYRIAISRAPRGEASGRVSGLLSTKNDLILTGEAALLYYFENPFGDEFEDWSSRRFGIRARSFGTMTTLKGFQPSEPLPLNFYSGELRYLIKKGMWNLDEVYGFLVSGNTAQIFATQKNYLGFGGFWGRSMPEGFDRWLRKMSWFNYPKYVDLDFTYLQPLTAGSEQVSWVANFHGKMFLGDELFVEAGLGLFQLSTDPRAEVSSLLGTVGLGLMF